MEAALHLLLYDLKEPCNYGVNASVQAYNDLTMQSQLSRKFGQGKAYRTPYKWQESNIGCSESDFLRHLFR
ncbi:hypothetical protein CPT76_21580 [Paenibacillus sp. AR247]|nr:hypothetical protein CPT76_21580 [Paenibacillus sp. AR247]